MGRLPSSEAKHHSEVDSSTAATRKVKPTWTPKVWKIAAFGALLPGCGPLLYVRFALRAKLGDCASAASRTETQHCSEMNVINWVAVKELLII